MLFREEQSDVNTITHAITGFAISEAFMLNPLVVVIASIIPDIDYLTGIEHRTITHSLLVMVIATIIIWKYSGKKNGFSFLLGFASHLMLDSLTPMGVPLFYPLDNYFSFNVGNWNDPVLNIGIIIVCAIIILNKDSIREYLLSLEKGVLLKSTLLFLVSYFSLLSFFNVTGCAGDPDTIGIIRLMPGESKVLASGVICSEVTNETSSSGNNYQVFTLCDDTGNITIWKSDYVLESNLSSGDLVSVCGKFTRSFNEPEIYYVTSVTK